jgi:hypothetical protein
MSSPGVTKLAKRHIGKTRVWLDDNIGESIHIHIDEFRLDLTIEEFSLLKKDILDALELLYPIEGLDIRKINPVFLSIFLIDRLPDIEKVTIDEVMLNDIFIPKTKLFIFKKLIPLKQSKVVKALHGDTKENDRYRRSHYNNQTSTERLNLVLDSLSKYSYPYNGKYIILYNDEMEVRDGQHRAACLLHLYGNIRIPIMRIYFRNSEPSFWKLRFHRLVKVIRRFNVRNIAKLLLKTLRYTQFALYKILHKTMIQLINKEFQ